MITLNWIYKTKPAYYLISIDYVNSKGRKFHLIFTIYYPNRLQGFYLVKQSKFINSQELLEDLKKFFKENKNVIPK